MENIEHMMLLNQKFQLLKLSLDESMTRYIPDDYSYAWDSGVYPALNDGAEWHLPYEKFFAVDQSMLIELLKFLDSKALKNEAFSFYDLEEHYGISGSTYGGDVWQRHTLIPACRYLFLNDCFNQKFWTNLCENGKCPSEAHSITRPFTIDSVYLA